MKGGGRPWPHLEATPFEVRGANGNPRTERDLEIEGAV